MAIQRTVTTPGSYEAPVEGIVDYGAFSRGFASSFKIPEQEKEKIPDLITLEDIDYAGTASKSGGLGLTGEASQQMNDSLDAELRNLQAQLDVAVTRGDLAAQRQIQKNYNLIKKTVAGAQFGFNHIASSEGAFDTQQAADLKLGVKADGTRMSFYEISQLKNQTKDSNFGFVFDYAKGTGGISANGFTFGTNNMNADTVSKLTPLTSNLSSAIKNYNQLNEVELQTRTDIKLDPTKQRTIKSYTKDSVDALNAGAENFGKQFKSTNPDTYQAAFLDTVLGEHRSRAQDPTRVSFTDSFGSDGFKVNPEDEKGYTTDDFIAHIQKIPGKEIPGNVVDALMEKRAQEKYKANVGSKIYKENKFGFAVERNPIISTRERDPKTETTSAAGIVEDLNTQFNSITSDAEREFSKPAYKAGTVRSGEDEAPQMFNFLTNKSYMKGGNKKSINNVEYRIVGEGEDRKIFLDIFTVSSGKEDKLATVDLGDTIARRDFLTNIGQGLAVTSSEKQAVREETKALTESREIAFDVFKGLNVGGKESSRWNVLSKAIRNNSSEGLNLEERRAFLKAGYGKQ